MKRKQVRTRVRPFVLGALVLLSSTSALSKPWQNTKDFAQLELVLADVCQDPEASRAEQFAAEDIGSVMVNRLFLRPISNETSAIKQQMQRSPIYLEPMRFVVDRVNREMQNRCGKVRHLLASAGGESVSKAERDERALTVFQPLLAAWGGSTINCSRTLGSPSNTEEGRKQLREIDVRLAEIHYMLRFHTNLSDHYAEAFETTNLPVDSDPSASAEVRMYEEFKIECTSVVDALKKHVEKLEAYEEAAAIEQETRQSHHQYASHTSMVMGSCQSSLDPSSEKPPKFVSALENCRKATGDEWVATARELAAPIGSTDELEAFLGSATDALPGLEAGLAEAQANERTCQKLASAAITKDSTINSKKCMSNADLTNEARRYSVTDDMLYDDYMTKKMVSCGKSLGLTAQITRYFKRCQYSNQNYQSLGLYVDEVFPSYDGDNGELNLVSHILGEM
jgi:hypothetical protein